MCLLLVVYLNNAAAMEPRAAWYAFNPFGPAQPFSDTIMIMGVRIEITRRWITLTLSRTHVHHRRNAKYWLLRSLALTSSL